MIKAFLNFFKTNFRKPQGKPTGIQDVGFIHQWEGLRLEAYQDTGGVWTIGYGTTRGVHPGMTITKKQAEEFFKRDLQWVEDTLNSLVKVPLSQNQYDALGSLVYNIGATQFAKSTLLRVLNQQNYQEAAKQFLRWVYDNGRVIRGLQNRRRAEMKKFLS